MVLALVDVPFVVWHGKVPCDACSVEACKARQCVPVEESQVIFLKQVHMYLDTHVYR